MGATRSVPVEHHRGARAALRRHNASVAQPVEPTNLPAHTGRRRARIVAAVAGIAVAGLGVAGFSTGDDTPPSEVGAAVGSAAAGDATSSAPTSTTRPLGPDIPDLPIPGPIPLDAHAPTPEVVLGTLEIPKIEVSQPLQEGMTLTAINRGPSHWPGTAMPGDFGNVVVAGHRVTYFRPFYRLDELVPGDLVHFKMNDGRTHTYAVREIVIVNPNDLWIADQTYAHTATLFGCHPKHSARQRIVASLELLGEDGIPVDDKTPPISDLRRDAWTDEVFMLPPDVAMRPGEPPNLSAPGVAVQIPGLETADGSVLLDEDGNLAPPDSSEEPAGPQLEVDG